MVVPGSIPKIMRSVLVLNFRIIVVMQSSKKEYVGTLAMILQTKTRKYFVKIVRMLVNNVAKLVSNREGGSSTQTKFTMIGL